MKMVAVCLSGMLVNIYQTAGCHIPGHITLHDHHIKNLRSNRNIIVYSLCYWGSPENLLFLSKQYGHSASSVTDSKWQSFWWSSVMETSVAWTMVTPIQGWGRGEVIESCPGHSKWWITVVRNSPFKIGRRTWHVPGQSHFWSLQGVDERCLEYVLLREKLCSLLQLLFNK